MRTILLFFLVVTTLGACRSSSVPVTEIRDRSAWQAAPPLPYKTHTPVRITVHHEGTALTVKDDAALKINRIQRWGMGPDRNWKDIPYHFLIAPDGTIFAGRDVYTVGETNTEYDPTGHLLICCLGNLDKNEVPAAQLQSLVRLIAWSSRTYKIPLSTLATHRDHSKQTTCPGQYLYRYFSNGYVLREVKKVLRRS